MADFKEAYQFGRDQIEVVIQNKGGGHFTKYLRVNPNSHDFADPSGGTGKWARWIVELQGGNQCKLKSKATGKYLRIEPNASLGAENKVDIKGTGGKWTVFKIHKQGQPGHVKLESAQQNGKYLAVQKDNKIRIGNGGPWTELIFRKEAAVEFTKPYLFAKKNIVVIQHRGGGGQGSGPTRFLRVKPGALGHADPDGGKGEFAQWEAEPSNGGAKCTFKSVKTGKYLRIFKAGKQIDVNGIGGGFTVFKVHKQGDGTVKLQSNHTGSAYIAVGPANNVRPGNGGPFTKMCIFRKN